MGRSDRSRPRPAATSLTLAVAGLGVALAWHRSCPDDARPSVAASAWAALAVLALTAAAWTVRAMRAARARTAAARPMSAEAMAALITFPSRGGDGDGIRWGWQAWVRLRDAADPGRGARLQRVAWHPRLDGLAPGTAVSVHGRLDGTRGVVVVLPDGVGLQPVGPLRERAPRHALLMPRRDARTHRRVDAWAATGGQATGPDTATARAVRRAWPAGPRPLLLGVAVSALPAVSTGPVAAGPSWLAVTVAASVAVHALLVDEP